VVGVSWEDATGTARGQGSACPRGRVGEGGPRDGTGGGTRGDRARVGWTAGELLRSALRSKVEGCRPGRRLSVHGTGGSYPAVAPTGSTTWQVMCGSGPAAWPGLNPYETGTAGRILRLMVRGWSEVAPGSTPLQWHGPRARPGSRLRLGTALFGFRCARLRS